MEPIAKMIKATKRNMRDKHPLVTHFLVIPTSNTESNIAPME